jgi:hypothetical protein
MWFCGAFAYGPKVTKSANSGLPRKSVLLGQSKTKMDSGNFDTWHHGGNNK